jgi:uncharacterized membrane protein
MNNPLYPDGHQRLVTIPHESRPPVLARVVERNIRALLARREQEDKQRSAQDRLADRITTFAGSMRFVYLHLCLFGLWILVNVFPGIPSGWRFDPSLVVLAMAASVEAIFLSTFVLISQNRMQALADKRADLDLQVSLLSEHEVTRLITLVSAMAQKMGIEAADDPELSELSQDVAPERVLDTMDENARRLGNGHEKTG